MPLVPGHVSESKTPKVQVEKIKINQPKLEILIFIFDPDPVISTILKLKTHPRTLLEYSRTSKRIMANKLNIFFFVLNFDLLTNDCVISFFTVI